MNVHAEIAAVNYLNMLPYFAFSETVSRVGSPRELNRRAIEGAVGMACMSAIAGISAGFAPLAPFMGIGAEDKVESVYLEPVVAGPRAASDEVFWASVLARNDDGYHRLRFDIETGRHGPRRSRVRIVSHGASEQSEWLFRVLLAAQEIETSVTYVPTEWLRLGGAEIRERVEAMPAPEAYRGAPTAVLAIGDPALDRRALHPGAERYDLATLWSRFAGLPCVFAVWFATAAGSGLDTQPILAALGAWESAPADRRWQVVEEFLATSETGVAGFAEVARRRDPTLSYLDNIVFRFDERYRRTFAAYCVLHAHFGTLRAA